jgi:hypothetical protein
MKKLSISINLLQLQGAKRITSQSGKDCIVIDLAASRAKPHQNGKVYLNLEAISNRDGEDQYRNTHFIAETVTKDERQNGVKLPIIGNGKEWSNEDYGRQKMHGSEAPARTTRNIPRAQPQEQDHTDTSEIPW